MDRLAGLVTDFLAGAETDIVASDMTGAYTRLEFRARVEGFIEKLDRYWANIPPQARGVAVVLERNVDYLAAIFASWLAGGYYLPLNCDNPEQLNAKQIAATEVSVVMRRAAEAGEISFEANQPLNVPEVSRPDMAYVIFTSGSTGDKKGVAITRASFVSYCDGVGQAFSDTFQARSLVINGEMTFDISLADIAFALMFKTEICLTPQATNLLSLCALIQKRKIESVYAVPSTWDKIIEIAEKMPNFSLGHVKNVFSGGEALTKRLLRKMRAACSDAVIYNMYGPTEFTVNAFHFHVDRATLDNAEDEVVPLGHPLPNVDVYIEPTDTDADNGELYLGGKQIMAGYVNSPQPFVEVAGKVYYPTGDLVYRNQRAEICYVGRLRDYEKISGYRINLASIERRLGEGAGFDLRLLVFDSKIICVARTTLSNKDAERCILNIGQDALEFYERPSRIVVVGDFPLNANGKLDRDEIIEMLNK